MNLAKQMLLNDAGVVIILFRTEVIFMLYYEGLSCPVCQKTFADGDDVVVCPHCGLPHHRACWQTINHCFAEEYHGTQQQWSRDAVKKETAKKATTPQEVPESSQVCPKCYTKNPEFAEICTHCGNILHPAEWSTVQEGEHPYEQEYTPYRAPFNNQDNQYSPVDPVGEVSAAELSALVGTNFNYYLPRFREVARGEGGGWHWAGFLLGPIWLLYRKQYLLGIFMFMMQTMLSVLTSVLYMPMNSAQTMQEMMDAMTQIAMEPLFLPVWVLTSVLFVGRLLLGLRGSDLYYFHCVRKINNAKRSVPDISAAELSSLGGTSVGIVILFYVLSMVLSSAFSSLLM